MLSVLLILALIVRYVPACETCGLAFLGKPFAHFGTSSTGPDGTLTVSTNESAWTFRDVFVIGLLVAALATAAFHKKGDV